MPSNKAMLLSNLLHSLVLSVVAFVLSSAQVARADALTVAVAANVKYAFADLQQAFSKETGLEIKGVFGSSGQLTAQIKSGAPFDIFLSADMEYPEALFRDQLAATAPKVYANGVLVLWTRSVLDVGKGIQIVTDPAVHKIAVANPRLAPYGREAMRVLEHFGLRVTVEPKLVYGESIAQVSQYIDSGAVDIGFTAKSVVLAPGVQGKGKWIELPRESYQPIAQGVVVLKHGAAASPDAARRFVAFLSSPAARAIFEKYGYILP